MSVSFGKVRVALVLALLVAPLVTACDEKPEPHFDRAVNAVAKGDLAAGVIELKNALKLDPKMMEARVLLARVSLDLGNGAAAEKEILRASELGIEGAQVQPILVRALFQQREFEKVVSASEQLAVGLHEKDRVEVLSSRARALLRTGQADEAKIVIDEALAVDSDSAAPLLAMAEMQMQADRRDPDAARDWLQRAVQASPDFADAWSLIGDLNLLDSKLSEAEDAFSHAIEARAYLTQDLAKRALVRVQQGRFEDAQADLQQLKSAGLQNHHFVLYVEGLSLFDRGKYEAAAEAFSSSLNNSPGFVNSKIYLAITQLILGNEEQARRLADQASFDAPNSISAQRLLGSTLVRQGEYDSASEVLQVALEQSPDDPILIRMLGSLALWSGKAEQSVEFFERLVAVEPDSQAAKEKLLLAKFVAGKTSSDDFVGSKSGSDAAGEFPVREMMQALDALRKNNFGDALEMAKDLHNRYPDNVEPINLMAACYFASGQWDLGKAELEKVLEMKPMEQSATRNLAAVLAREGDLKGATYLLEPLVAAYPKNEAAALLLYDLQARSNDKAQSIRTLEQALNASPESSRVRVKLVRAYFADGNYTKALDLTAKLSNDDFSKQPQLLEFRGKAQMMTGDLSAAIRSFEQLVGLVPDSGGAHYLYGDTLARSGELDRASKELLRVLEIDPQHLPARVIGIKLLVRRGDIPAAKEALSRLRNDFGDRPEVLGLEGWFALGTGQFAEAEQQLRAATAERPESETALLLVKALWAQEKYDPALAFMNQWLNEHPQDVAMRFHLAGGYLSLNKFDEAEATYAKILETFPNHVPSLNNLAWLSRDKNAEQAIVYAERAFELEWSNPDVIDTLALLLLRSGDKARGMQLLRDAARLAPNDLEIQVHFGRALIQNGRDEEARNVLSALVGAERDSPIGQEAQLLLDGISGR